MSSKVKYHEEASSREYLELYMQLVGTGTSQSWETNRSIYRASFTAETL